MDFCLIYSVSQKTLIFCHLKGVYFLLQEEIKQSVVVTQPHWYLGGVGLGEEWVVVVEGARGERMALEKQEVS